MVNIKLKITKRNEVCYVGAPYCLTNVAWSYRQFYFEREETKKDYHRVTVRRFIERMYLRYG